MKKKIKFNLENSGFNINDFQNHAIERNLTNKINGGFPEVTFAEMNLKELDYPDPDWNKY